MAFPLNQASNSIPVQDISTPLFDQIEKVGQDLVGATSSMREFMKAVKENIPPSLLNTLDTFANKVNASTVRLSMLLKHPDLKKTKAPPKEEEKKPEEIKEEKIVITTVTIEKEEVSLSVDKMTSTGCVRSFLIYIP